MKWLAFTAILAFTPSIACAENFQQKGTGSTRLLACAHGATWAKNSAEYDLLRLSPNINDYRTAWGRPQCECEEDKNSAEKAEARWVCIVNIEGSAVKR